jgi:hypothetical protein
VEIRKRRKSETPSPFAEKMRTAAAWSSRAKLAQNLCPYCDFRADYESAKLDPSQWNDFHAYAVR